MIIKTAKIVDMTARKILFVLFVMKDIQKVLIKNVKK